MVVLFLLGDVKVGQKYREKIVKGGSYGGERISFFLCCFHVKEEREK